ncbi:hypothetical protein LGR54_13350 [Ancylobacter sp. Lp-2]|uniref:hypothetical protein n=1 Tax=Ancylobacter sp. Lp-2 TaxID=2881339 RepID=UPI001E3EEDCF|nr:hypothetical protein [Ancylobacter sp. Lp-2]MCB4769598.1 hypothetical protein [Ancylobacter sp. Lp-2]
MLSVAIAVALSMVGEEMSRSVGGRIATMASSLVSQLRRSMAAAEPGVVHQTLVLAEGAGGHTAERITIDIWRARVEQDDFSDVGGSGTALLFYTPGSGKQRTDNATTAAALARLGYVVVALDDVEQVPELVSAGVRPLLFDFTSEAAYKITLDSADEKVHRQALRLVEVLDRLAELRRRPDGPSWLESVSLDRVGAFGWSLGGSTAAEASVLDPRIIAVANLDGWLFGRAAHGAVTAPYLLMLSDFPFPSDAEADDATPARRYEARLTRRDLTEEFQLVQRPGSLGIRLVGAVHENLSDFALGLSFWRSWLRADPVRTKAIIEACLASFFDHHLRGRLPAGCLEEAYIADGVQRFRTIEWPRPQAARAPT